jgi:hypothetical protein
VATTDAVNGTIQVLVPRNSKLYVEHLQPDAPSPDNTDAAEYRLATSVSNATILDSPPLMFTTGW